MLMEQEIEQENKQQSSNKLYLLVVFFLLALLLLSMIFIGLSVYRGGDTGEPPKEVEEEVEKNMDSTNRNSQIKNVGTDGYLNVINLQEKLSGRIYMTLIDSESDISKAINFGLPYQTYYYSFVHSDKKVELLETEMLPTNILMYPDFSDSLAVAMSLSPLVTTETILAVRASSEYPTLSSELFEFNTTNQEFVQLTNRAMTEQGVEIQGKRIPSISPNGSKVIFSVLAPKNSQYDFEDITNWRVFMFDRKTSKETDLLSGIYGRWLNDDYLVYLKNDGVYVKNISQDISLPEARVIKDDLNRPYKASHHIGVSDLGNFIAVTFPRFSGDSEVLVYELEIDELTGDVSPAIVEVIDLGDKKPYWPTFSPGGRYLAYQVYDSATGEGLVEVYDFVQRTVVEEFSLDGYQFNYSFVTDWSL